MKKTARILAFALIAAASFTVFTGFGHNFFPDGSEITTFEIVRILGLDKSGEDGVEVTLIAERAKPSPGEEGGGMSYEIMSADAPTAFEAVSKIRAETDKKQVFGYVDYIIFGEDTAEYNFTKFADFPSRSPEIRYSPKVFIVRGGSAKDLLRTTSSPDKYIGDSLDNLSRNVNDRSDFSLIRNIELMNMLGKKDAAAVIPAIEAHSPEEDKLVDGELPERELKAAGYAVLRDSKLAGYFDGADARAYNFLTDSMKSCTYSVEDTGAVGLRVQSEGFALKPRWEDGLLRGVTYTVRVGAGITEQRTGGSENGAIAANLEDAIERELRSTIEKAQNFGLDCFGLGERLNIKHPYKWRNYKKNWRDDFSILKIDAKVEAIVRRSYDINEAVGTRDASYFS